VEHLSKKKKKTVQHAEAQKPSQDSSKVVPEEPSKEATVEAVPQKFTLIEVPKLSKEQVEAAKAFNFPLDKLFEGLNRINEYAASVEARFGIIEKNLGEAPQKVVEALKAEALKRQTENAQQMQQQPQAQQGGGLGALAQFLPLLGSGGSNPMQEQMMQKMFEKTMQGMDLSNALTKAMIIKLAPSLAEELTKTIVATGA